MTKSTLSNTARATLTAAAARDDRVALPPDHLPAAAQRAVVQSLFKAGLLEEVAAADDQPAWRTTEDGLRLALRMTDAGLSAINADATNERPAEAPETAQIEPSPGETASGSPQAPMPPDAMSARAPHPAIRHTLRAAAQAALTAWDGAAEGCPALPAAMDALRAALAKAPSARARTGESRPARTDTKQATVLALLRRPEGVSGPAMAEATGWASHTVRGFLAGLAKKGITVTVLERVRQVGPGKEGAKGSYTVYRVAEAG